MGRGRKHDILSEYLISSLAYGTFNTLQHLVLTGEDGDHAHTRQICPETPNTSMQWFPESRLEAEGMHKIHHHLGCTADCSHFYTPTVKQDPCMRD